MKPQNRLQKIILLIIFSSIGIASNSSCYAQSIIGKWKLVSIKGYVTNKSSGTNTDLSKSKLDEVYEFKADKTFLITNSAGKKRSDGSYSITGEQLRLILDTKGLSPEQKMAVEKRNQIATLTFAGSTVMGWHSFLNDDEYKSDVEMTFNKF